MRLFRLGFIAGCLYPEAIFRIKTNEKVLCLTFDDGPHPDTTQQLLDILEKHSVKAVFFCSGKAAEKYTDLVNLIIEKGHLIGNHGYDHLIGWRTINTKYFEEFRKAEQFTSSVLMRPPFGKIKLSQFRLLKKRYKIVFWDLIPYDFDKSFGAENTLKILKKKIRPGSVIVLHDKPSSCCGEIIEEFLKHAIKEGYRFVIPASIENQARNIAASENTFSKE
jgi:peptidoglycan/xylan/chitin deacetylase (PgdA/CDA1 family)